MLAAHISSSAQPAQCGRTHGMHTHIRVRSTLVWKCVNTGMQAVSQLFIPPGTFWHFVKCQKVRTQLHAMHSSGTKRTLAYDMRCMANAKHTYARLLGS
jgi:hypothetical protein